MTKSKLVNYTDLSPNCNKRTEKISKITVHHMAGNLSVEMCGNVFKQREASANYGIGSDGRVGCYVEEEYRSWASANEWNDQRAITIEVANDKPSDKDNWHVSDKAYNKLIDLCVDICERYNFTLTYTGDKNGRLTRHNMFVATACPGPYLQGKFDDIVKQVNKKLEKKYMAKVYKKGDISIGVLAAKEMLIVLYNYGVIKQKVDENGIFGNGTEIAAKEVQKLAKLQQTGYIDEKTIKEIRKLVDKYSMKRGAKGSGAIDDKVKLM